MNLSSVPEYFIVQEIVEHGCVREKAEEQNAPWNGKIHSPIPGQIKMISTWKELSRKNML